MNYLTILSLLLSILSISSEAKVYRNMKVGNYEASIDLNTYAGQPLFEVMKDVIYPAINEQAAKQQRWGEHIEGVKRGEGVEVVLGRDVTTYHVKYKAEGEDRVERSGRSFGVVGSGSTKKYVADASYKHYLTTLEAILSGNDHDARAFFRAIIKVIADSDPSEIAALKNEFKQVAADFVAIYVAEQYRRLTATSGEYLGSNHQWDDALVQVTLLSAFHSGQDEMMMFYEGEFTGKVYHQDECLYNAKDEDERRANTKKRKARLHDYWQFTVRSECPGRSGVNLTRKDFSKLGNALTQELNAQLGTIKDLDLGSAYNRNFIKAATQDLLEGKFESKASDYTEILVDVLMTLRAQANTISEKLAN